MAALLPPSSSRARANRAASTGPTARPMAVEPVAETRRHLGRGDQGLADLAAADQHLRTAPPARRRTGPRRARTGPGRPGRSAASSPTASRPPASPQTRARAAFHDQTATGKLKARDHADHAQRMPGLHHPVIGPLGGDGQAEQLARQADGVVADVDHLLHLAQALGEDLAGLQGDQPAEVGLGGAQLLAEQADQLAAARGRNLAPGQEGLVRGVDGPGAVLRGGVMDMGDDLAGDRRRDRTRAAGRRRSAGRRGGRGDRGPLAARCSSDASMAPRPR